MKTIKKITQIWKKHKRGKKQAVRTVRRGKSNKRRKNLKIEKKSDETNIELRDYFVRTALAGLLPLGLGMWSKKENPTISENIESLVERAYMIADEVLKQRR